MRIDFSYSREALNVTGCVVTSVHKVTFQIRYLRHLQVDCMLKNSELRTLDRMLFTEAGVLVLALAIICWLPFPTASQSKSTVVVQIIYL